MSKHPLIFMAAIALLLGSTEPTAAEKKAKTRDTALSTAQFQKVARPEPTKEFQAKHQKPRSLLIKAFNAEKYDEAMALLSSFEKLPELKSGDVALIQQIRVLSRRAQQAPNAEIVQLIETALQGGGLDNELHYSLMAELAQRWFEEDDYPKTIQVTDRFFEETGQRRPGLLAIRGNSHYRLGQLAKAELDLKEAVSASAQSPDQSWVTMLVRVLADQGKKEESAVYAKRLTTTSGQADLMQQAAAMADIGDYAKAAEHIDKARELDLLKTERDYTLAYITYNRAKNRDADVAAVISDGLKKNLLKANHNLLSLMAEGYYYSNETEAAVDAWAKAAPLAKDGSTYLNLAIALIDLERYDEAQAAAQAALKKGMKNPKEARDVLQRIEAAR